jgi:hypothetical protein
MIMSHICGKNTALYIACFELVLIKRTSVCSRIVATFRMIQSQQKTRNLKTIEREVSLFSHITKLLFRSHNKLEAQIQKTRVALERNLHVIFLQSKLELLSILSSENTQILMQTFLSSALFCVARVIRCNLNGLRDKEHLCRCTCLKGGIESIAS